MTGAVTDADRVTFWDDGVVADLTAMGDALASAGETVPDVDGLAAAGELELGGDDHPLAWPGGA
jgi:hypothetical protein